MATEAKSSNERSNDPRGVVAVYVIHNRVIAYAACFQLDRPGGYTELEAQKIRARDRLHVEVVKALASPTMYEGMRQHDFDNVVASMTGTVKLIPVGYGDNADDRS